jgi:hypothetical protein
MKKIKKLVWTFKKFDEWPIEVSIAEFLQSLPLERAVEAKIVEIRQTVCIVFYRDYKIYVSQPNVEA